jgi:hypothetical protein
VLGGDRRKTWVNKRASADFRNQHHVLAVSADGLRVAFGYEPFGASRTTFLLSERRLAAGPPPAGVSAAQTTAPGLAVADWLNDLEPTLNGRRLPLGHQHETSHSLAVAPDGRRFVLGTNWGLRLFDRDRRMAVWALEAPGNVWAVTVTADGRFAVAAYGDGTIRWHRLSDGRELLALYPHVDRERWVLWTPQGYYMASPGGEDLIGWQVNRGWDEVPEFYSASRFRDRFHRPDVIDLVLEELDVVRAVARADAFRGSTQTLEVKGVPPSPGVGAPQATLVNLPPIVRIVAPEDGAPIEGGDVTVSFEADAADPVRSMMALVNGASRCASPVPRSSPGAGPGGSWCPCRRARSSSPSSPRTRRAPATRRPSASRPRAAPRQPRCRNRPCT